MKIDDSPAGRQAEIVAPQLCVASIAYTRGGQSPLRMPIVTFSVLFAVSVTVASDARLILYQSVSRELLAAQKVPQTVWPTSMFSKSGATGAQSSGQRLAASPAQMPSQATEQQKESTAQTASWHVGSSQPTPPFAEQQFEAGTVLQPPFESSPQSSFST
jgi:hypothetical protein